ncbi:nucleolar complex protein 2 homolog [Ctenocephalides felis]|uniref:nucleolar complex protein 2 homolog n=1 Tax=Ctenocephalides felis TaxID=7515 RepID=UPI000E6E5821|nr:nucleolar complex protein 2 homolog [Ctenocephalides felis]
MYALNMTKVKKNRKAVGLKEPKVMQKKVKTKKTSNAKFSSMSANDFMNNVIDENQDSHDELNVSPNTPNTRKKSTVAQSETDSESDGCDDVSHAKSLERLRSTDPDFYQFLQENDQSLLDFDVSDNEQDEDDNDSDGSIHQPNAELEGASDESDFEHSDDLPTSGTITLQMVKKWHEELQQPKVSINVLENTMKAFNAALLCISNEEAQKSNLRIDGSGVFNAVIQLCVLNLQPAIAQFLKLTTSQKPHKCKRWVKVKTLIKGYFIDLLKLLEGITSPNILAVLLKHLHQMQIFLSSFLNVSKQILKKLIGIWATSEETVRVLAFICILRITRQQQASLLDTVLKSMYITYVKNCKFVSPTTLPNINFMRRSLMEMYALDLNISYPHVFLYIRQLAIHLRNAITLHKKENIQTVYNWQYVGSIHLWADLLSFTHNKPQLQPLIYPLVMIVINAIKLVPTSQYYPLRFHCLQILNSLSKNTGLYIPILPLILEVLAAYDFNQKHKKVSLKPMQFTCILRASKSQMMENGFKDAVFDSIYKLLFETLTNEAQSIAFPDFIVPFVMQAKDFLKRCHIAKYCKQLKHLLDKVIENSKVIDNERSKITLDLNNKQIINSWETQICGKGLPLLTYYQEWSKVNEIQKKKKYTNNEEIAEYSFPKINKTKRKIERGPAELFPSDSEDEEINRFKNKADNSEKPKKNKKQTKKPKIVPQDNIDDTIESNEQDLVENFDMTKW